MTNSNSIKWETVSEDGNLEAGEGLRVTTFVAPTKRGKLVKVIVEGYDDGLLVSVGVSVAYVPTEFGDE